MILIGINLTGCLVTEDILFRGCVSEVLGHGDVFVLCLSYYLGMIDLCCFGRGLTCSALRMGDLRIQGPAPRLLYFKFVLITSGTTNRRHRARERGAF